MNKNVVELGNCSIELVTKKSKNDTLYEACELVLPNGERRQIGFKLDYFVLRKKSKGGNKE